LQNDEVQNPITLTFTVTRSNKWWFCVIFVFILFYGLTTRLYPFLKT
jgi:hypothetical protein